MFLNSSFPSDLPKDLTKQLKLIKKKRSGTKSSFHSMLYIVNNLYSMSLEPKCERHTDGRDSGAFRVC